MAEPDDVMPGPLWPPDWNTGWITCRYANVVGIPKPGKLRVMLNVGRAVSPAYETAVIGGSIDIPLENGIPSTAPVVIDGTAYALVTINSDGVPCIEVPVGDDPDVQPNPIQLIVDEVFDDGGGSIVRVVVSETNTLDSPLWISGNLSAVADQPGVVAEIIWKVPLEASGIPPLAQVGDTIWYLDTGRITRVTSL